MIDIKLIVLFVYIVRSSCFNNYCEICRNHTLCLFNKDGPSIACQSYKNTALLRQVEINEIVRRINERRNYIAMGLNKNLPQAANMKKIFWSSELAAFAQRWVDQCDQSLQPDKEDQCRDLAHTKVGQNIATILGPTSGLNVKSFVEMWYIQILKYKGHVTYYNQSRHHNTDYFTQLIWAETDSVGCGKARFYVDSKNTIVERLVCNFAPKGNNYGKPVYTIGFPGTQCPGNMISDSIYTGLCVNRYNKIARRFTTLPSQVSSLLRILNLSNSSVKQEIDPIRNNLKLINNTSFNSKDQRNQKIRHVYFNHTHGGMKRVAPLRKQNFRNPSMNLSYINHPQERGHSRVYHGYESHVHNHDQNDEKSDSNFRKFDFSTDYMNSYSYSDSRKHYLDQNYRCTRKTKPSRISSAGYECNTPGCTRGQMNDNCHQLTTICHSSVYNQNLCTPTKWNYLNELCSCNKFTPCYTTPTRCACGLKCGCVNVGATTCCPEMLRMKDNPVNPDETRKSQIYKLYDVPAPLVVRSGNEKLNIASSSPKAATKYMKSIKKYISGTEYNEYHDQVKDSNVRQDFNVQGRDYLYETFDSSERNRRDLEDDVTFKPFWEIDQYNHKRRSELKSIRYTTLGFKAHRKTKRGTTAPKPVMVTESITITTKNTPIARGIKDPVSEKYLSFDELMHIRKFTNEESYQYARRKASDENKTVSPPTSEITTNTPFIRKKHCTRKLTCTWTALTMSGGDMIAGGGGFDRGSRTPPGYVEGCTRTSTCTREFMDRNKMSTIPDHNLSSEPTPEDEDYCERRALKRNLEGGEPISESTVNYQKTYIQDIASTIENKYYRGVSKPIINREMFAPQYGCICSQENSRSKREKQMHNQQIYDKYIIREMSLRNDLLLKNIDSIEKKNAIKYFPNTIESIKCQCSGQANVLLACNMALCFVILLFY